MKIEAALIKHEAAVMRLPNVTGIGIGERAGKRVIKVFVTRKRPAADLRPDEIIPKTLEGHPTDVEEIGAVMPQALAPRKGDLQ